MLQAFFSDDFLLAPAEAIKDLSWLFTETIVGFLDIKAMDV